MSFDIRPAKPSDALNLAALSIQVWLHTYAKAGVRDVLSRYAMAEFTEARLFNEIADETKRIVVCEIDGCLAGYVKIAFNARCPIRNVSQPEVETLYVQEHFHRRGIGSALLEAAIEACRSYGHSGMWLLVNHENVRARKFYEDKSFEKIGSSDFQLENERHPNDLLVKAF
ncbi:GNAT family N-acetyltransferase [Phyllobacterium sp. LjRoot231]|uniref:GNAT family N-acetyltransferase n=1 Tax=Phyllobacterium sp. LjRoot231 TaxID=3342289 RepID=UPI003ECE7667